jgi:hypothetical protein
LLVVNCLRVRPGVEEVCVGALSRPDLLSDLTLQFDAIAERTDAEHDPASVRAFEFAARIRYLDAKIDPASASSTQGPAAVP